MVCERHLRATGTVEEGKGTQQGGPCVPKPTWTDLGYYQQPLVREAVGATVVAALEAGQDRGRLGEPSDSEACSSSSIQDLGLLKFNMETWLCIPCLLRKNLT